MVSCSKCGKDFAISRQHAGRFANLLSLILSSTASFCFKSQTMKAAQMWTQQKCGGRTERNLRRLPNGLFGELWEYLNNRDRF